MSKKAYHTIITLFVLPGLTIGIVTFFSPAFPSLLPENSHQNMRFQKACDMSHCNDHCNSNMPKPKCPLCPSSGSANLVLHLDSGFYLPILTSSMVSISHILLTDQGFVRPIFHPPTTALQTA